MEVEAEEEADEAGSTEKSVAPASRASMFLVCPLLPLPRGPRARYLAGLDGFRLHGYLQVSVL